MPAVTVAGTNSQTVTLHYDTNANAVLAQQLAGAITAGVEGGSIFAVSDTRGPPPPPPQGKTGAFFLSQAPLTSLPHGYTAVVDTAKNAVIFGSGDNGESVLSSTGNLTFIATGGSGTVVAGGGNNNIIIQSSVTGGWSINTGNGPDNVFADGGGNDTIHAGGGHNVIRLGSGNSIIQSTGADTVFAGSGSETIVGVGTGSDVISGGSGTLFFIGGAGPDVVHGGTGGNNFLFAGTGAATLFGGGNGDDLIAHGSAAQALHAGVGNETLFGGASSGHDTFFGSSGNATITAGIGTNQFVFTDGQAGGTASIQGFMSGRDTIDLMGYGKNAVAQALKSQTSSHGSSTITLSDHTTITFAGVGSLSASDFATTTVPTGGVGGTGGTGTGDDGQHGHGSQGTAVSGDHGQIRDSLLKPS